MLPFVPLCFKIKQRKMNEMATIIIIITAMIMIKTYERCLASTV